MFRPVLLRKDGPGSVGCGAPEDGLVISVQDGFRVKGFRLKAFRVKGFRTKGFRTKGFRVKAFRVKRFRFQALRVARNTFAADSMTMRARSTAMHPLCNHLRA